MADMNITSLSCRTYLSDLPSPVWKWTFGVINTINSLTATIANSLAFYIMLSSQDMQTLSNRILISLIITDLIAGVSVAPLHAAQLLVTSVSLNCTVEQVRRSLAAVLVGASALTVATISYDRYLHLTKLNNYYKYMTKQKVTGFLILAWLVPGSLPIIRMRLNTEKAYVSIFTTLMLSIFVVLIVFYALTLSSLRERAAWRQKSAQIERQQMRTVKTVITIITCYVVMGLPITIPIILMHVNIPQTTMNTVYVSTLTLNMLNSTANPIIYYYRNRSIRKSARKLFGLDSWQSQNSFSSDGQATKNRSSTVASVSITQSLDTMTTN